MGCTARSSGFFVFLLLCIPVISECYPSIQVSSGSHLWQPQLRLGQRSLLAVDQTAADQGKEEYVIDPALALFKPQAQQGAEQGGKDGMPQRGATSKDDSYEQTLPSGTPPGTREQGQGREADAGTVLEAEVAVDPLDAAVFDAAAKRGRETLGKQDDESDPADQQAEQQHAGDGSQPVDVGGGEGELEEDVEMAEMDPVDAAVLQITQPMQLKVKSDSGGEAVDSLQLPPAHLAGEDQNSQNAAEGGVDDGDEGGDGEQEEDNDSEEAGEEEEEEEEEIDPVVAARLATVDVPTRQQQRAQQLADEPEPPTVRPPKTNSLHSGKAERAGAQREQQPQEPALHAPQRAAGGAQRQAQRVRQQQQQQVTAPVRQPQVQQPRQTQRARQQQQQQQQQQRQPRRGALLQDASRRSDAFATAQLAQQAEWRQQQEQEPAAAPLVGAQHAQHLDQQQTGRQLQEKQRRREGADAVVPGPKVPLADVAVMTVVMAGAAGLGALPFFFVRSLSRRMAGLTTAVACGVMFACSFDLVHTGQPYGPLLVVLGVVLGSMFIQYLQHWLEGMEDVQFENLHGAGARKTVLLVGVMAAHALGEGCGVGVSFVGERGWSQGVLTTLAIGIHNVPEGLAKATVLVGQGVGPRHALMWSVLTCLPQPLVALPSFMFVEAFEAILPIALGFAAGCMIWVVFAELLPDALEAAEAKQVASAATVAAAVLEGIRMVFEGIDGEGGGVVAPLRVFPGDLSLLLPALGVMLPAVAAAALAGGLLSNAGLATPVHFGVASALVGCMGALPLLRMLGGRLLWGGATAGAAGGGGVQLAVGAGAGAALTVLLRHQMLLAVHRGEGGVLLGCGLLARSFVDLEAAAKKASDNDLSSRGSPVDAPGRAHFVQATAYGGGSNGSAAGGNALVGISGAGMGVRPVNGAGMLAGSPASFPAAAAAAVPLFSGGLGGGGGKKGGLRLAAPQLAAAITALLALATYAVPEAWTLVRSMLSAGPHLSVLLLPAALSMLSLGAAAGAVVAAVSPAPSPRWGAWLGAALGCFVTLCTLVSLARFDPEGAPQQRSSFDPAGLTPRLQAVAAGALCMAGFILFGVGWSLHGRRTRGGVLLGVLLAAAVHGFAGALCMLTPYCIGSPLTH